MDDSMKKEDISMSYLAALCADAGIDFERTHHDNDSVDVIVKNEVQVDGINIRASIGFQLKATSSPSVYTENEENITFKLKVKNYNDLIKKSTMPLYLAVLVLPENEKGWVTWTIDELVIHGRMYYLTLAGQMQSDNSGSVTVRIDKGSQLNKDSLNALLIAAAKEVLG